MTIWQFIFSALKTRKFLLRQKPYSADPKPPYQQSSPKNDFGQSPADFTNPLKFPAEKKPAKKAAQKVLAENLCTPKKVNFYSYSNSLDSPSKIGQKTQNPWYYWPPIFPTIPS